MRKFRITLFVIIGILCLTALTYAAIPRVINYQGRLTDKDDNPLTGNFLVTFRFYDTEKEGLSIWEEGHILNIKNGLFCQTRIQPEQGHLMIWLKTNTLNRG